MHFTSRLRSAQRCLIILLLASWPPAIWAADATPHPIVVCIDPGHPSEAGNGARGKRVTEMHIAWAVALKLRTLLESDGDRVIMTKWSERQFVTNKDRAAVANGAHADLMVRLHCDSDAGTGIATFAPNRAGVDHGVRGPTPRVIAASRRSARLFHAAMIKSLGGVLHDRGLKPDTSTRIGGRHGALTGSIYSQVPVLLVEMCVLTNPRDEAFIATEGGQWRMARALEAGVLAAVGER